MSTNPNSAVGTNAAYGGRTSVKAFNDGLGAYSRGILSGWACSPNTGMTVSLGGDGTTRDIAIAEDAGGNKITVNNISEAPISVTMSAAPATNSRIDLIVAYVDNPPQGAATSIDNPGACGLIAVEGTAVADPVPPNDSAIRTAITADGASGATAYYVILAEITITSGTTDLTSDDIEPGDKAQLPNNFINSNNIDFTTFITNTDFVKSGTTAVTFQENNTAGGFAQVNFPTAFQHTPIVLACPPVGTGFVISLSVYSPSTTGFQLLGRSTGGSGSYSVQWIAFDPQMLPIAVN